MTKNTTVTLDEAVANSAALAEQWASSCRLPQVKARMQELWFNCPRCGHSGPLSTDGRCICCGQPPGAGETY